MKIQTITVNPLEVNCYIVSDEQTNEAAIIDPGMFFDQERQAIASYIAANELHVSHILLTHGHFDHAMSAQWCAEKFGNLKPCLHADDSSLMAKINDQMLMFMHRALAASAPVATTPIADGDTIQIGAVALRVIHTPGHTLGGVCYHCEEEGVLFSGDSLFYGSVGRTDLEGGDSATLTQSLRQRVMTLPEHTTVLPGHGPRTTIANELRYNPYI